MLGSKFVKNLIDTSMFFECTRSLTKCHALLLKLSTLDGPVFWLFALAC